MRLSATGDVSHFESLVDPPRTILLNEGAGGGGRAERRLGRAIRESGLSIDIRSVPPGGLDAEIDRLARDDSRPLAVAGGDGSLRSAADRVAGTGRVLLPVPTGTLNNFARRMGIADTDQAVAAIAEGRPRRVPIGIVDDQVFLNTMTFGCYAEVVRARDRWSRWLTRWPAAALGVTLTIARLRPLEFRMLLDGERMNRFVPLVWIGMGLGSLRDGAECATDRENDAWLEIALPRSHGRWKSVALLARLFGRLATSRGIAAESGLEVVRARTVVIDTGGPIDVTADGEILRIESPVFVGARPDGLCVLTPCGSGPR